MTTEEMRSEVIRLSLLLIADLEKMPFVKYERFRLDALNEASKAGLTAQLIMNAVFNVAEDYRNRAERRIAIG